MKEYDKVIDLAMRKGIFFPTAEIYSGPAGFWEYGPYGVAIKQNIISLWRKHMVQKDGMLEIDGCQILPEKVFQSSGHLTSFQDPLVECVKCKGIFRADKLIEDKTKKIIPEALKAEQFDKLIKKHKIACPSCKKELSKTRMFNLMVKTLLGSKQEDVAYMRPETCQSIFIDFPRIYKTMRAKLPIGIAQVGKSFRNEISPRQSIFRLKEFTQAEIEVFFNPKKEKDFDKFKEIKSYKLNLALLGKEDKIISISCADAVKKKLVRSGMVSYYLAILMKFFETAGIKKKNIRFREIGGDERAFYAKEAWDLEVKTSLGWMEIVANHYRTDYDLGLHSKGSKKDLSVMDRDEKVLPWVWEASMGIDRLLLMILDNAYTEEKVKGDKRIVLKLESSVAPVQVAIFPLMKKDNLPKKAKSVYDVLKEAYSCQYDEGGSIGKRYRRMDEIGCLYCITVDHQSLEDDTVTVRERDTMKQKRVKIANLHKALKF
jgi:glycyl-tRNA synthetase